MYKDKPESNHVISFDELADKVYIATPYTKEEDNLIVADFKIVNLRPLISTHHHIR